jgi:diaminopimelate decarboxylase
VSGVAQALGGVPLDRVLPALRRADAGARACWVYDLDALESRARRMRTAFAPISAHIAYALKANSLPALLATLRDAGLSAEAGSLGELEQAARAGFAASDMVLNGNGRTPEEAAWAAAHGIHSVNADSIEELELLEASAARAGRTLRVALRVNPDIDAPVHRYIATGHDEAKFGVAPGEALEAWAGRSRWPHLKLDGVHLHVGSQLLETEPLEQAARFALELAQEAGRRGGALGFVNLGGGFGVDYSGAEREFPLESYAGRIAAIAAVRPLEWVVEPGRWLVAPVGVLLAEVLWVKRRGRQRFVVLAAGLNDLLRPALYGARHRIVPIAPRPGAIEPATVVGPVCESADCFDPAAPLPPLERGDVVALLDAGAYAAVMSSNYNGRGRLAELIARAGALKCVRPGENAAAPDARDRLESVELPS